MIYTYKYVAEVPYHIEHKISYQNACEIIKCGNCMVIMASGLGSSNYPDIASKIAVDLERKSDHW